MKLFKFTFIIMVAVFIFYSYLLQSQTCSDCVCGTGMIEIEGEPPDTIFGGKFKPARSDIGGAPQDEDYLPVLVVFVQFTDEPYSYSTHPDAWNSEQPPNYLKKLIDTVRRPNSSSWFNTYNDFAISDYWHEFSRGKLHLKGRAESIILSHSTTWYQNYPNSGQVNQEVYDSLKRRLGTDWINYDRWRYNSLGNLTWGKDSLVDMICLVFRQRKNFYMGGSYLGVATLGKAKNDTNDQYTVFRDANNWIKIFGDSSQGNPIGSGARIHADSGIFSKQRFLDLASHEFGHYLFGFGHQNYGKMSDGNFSSVGFTSGWEFSLSPWEVAKMGI